jgi:hypothetical protein
MESSALFKEKRMFTLLSNQAKLLTLLGYYSSQDLETVSANLKLTIKLLSHNVTELLDNRRVHGVLLPQEDPAKNIQHQNIKTLSCEQLLLKQEYLINTINGFCLTEAIIVRDNFSNCLEFLAEEKFPTLPLAIVKQNKLEKVTITERDNVSPIRLTEIKQRLSQAVHSSENKHEQIKSRLNNLLAPSKTKTLTSISKQA